MKKLILLTAASLMGVGAVVGLSLANKGGEPLVTASRKNANAVSGNLFTQSNEGAHLPGNQVYFVDCSTDHWWANVDSKTSFYFFSDSGAGKIEAWAVDVVRSTWDRGDDNVYEAIVPAIPSNAFGYTRWEKVIAVRTKSAATEGSWDNKYFNQSDDMTIGTSGYNTVFLGSDGKYSINAISAVERLEILSFAQGWSKPAKNGSICDSDGNTDTSTLHTQWEASGTAFGKLGEDVKYKFSKQVAEADEEEDNTTASVPDFAARYDWIYYRYSVSCSLTNWADRTINF